VKIGAVTGILLFTSVTYLFCQICITCGTEYLYAQCNAHFTEARKGISMRAFHIYF